MTVGPPYWVEVLTKGGREIIWTTLPDKQVGYFCLPGLIPVGRYIPITPAGPGHVEKKYKSIMGYNRSFRICIMVWLLHGEISTVSAVLWRPSHWIWLFVYCAGNLGNRTLPPIYNINIVHNTSNLSWPVQLVRLGVYYKPKCDTNFFCEWPTLYFIFAESWYLVW